MPKTPVPGMGWFAWLKDTEGNVLGVWEVGREGELTRTPREAPARARVARLPDLPDVP